MRKATLFAAASLLAVALGGCGRAGEPAEGAAAAASGNTQEVVATQVNTAAVPSPAPVARAAPAGSAPPPSPAALPLKRGYYVASDTPCDQASNATVRLLQRDGIGGARDFCEFRKIEQTGPNTYRVTEACADLQDNAPPETSTATYIISGDTRFTSRSEDGWEYSARYCAQSSMPPDWRENDITDVTG